jgi:hypothetical protein
MLSCGNGSVGSNGRLTAGCDANADEEAEESEMVLPDGKSVL